MFEKLLSIGLMIQIVALGLIMAYWLPSLNRKFLMKIIGIYCVALMMLGIVFRYMPFLVDPR